MNGVRWTTGVGVALGGAGGALAALLGSPSAPVAEAPLPAPGPERSAPVPLPPPPLPAFASAVARAAFASASVPVPGSSPAPPNAVSAVAKTSIGTAPPLEVPTTREGLLKAEILCDQKKDFDQCTRAAEALGRGTTGPRDPEQAKRFRRIALTHLVTQCESGSPHACFVLAAKYRAGIELAVNPTTADVLEKRGLELCRQRSAPECK